MAINWRDIFRGIGAGATYVAGEMREQRIDEREEQQIKERADYANQLEKERERSRQEFQKKLAEDTAKMQSSLRMKERETGYIFDTFGLQMGKEYTKIADMPMDDPRRQEVLDKISFATNMLAEAKGGRTDFTSEELDMLPADLRMNFTGTILANRRFDEQQALATQIAKSQMQLRLAQKASAEGQLEYFKHLKETGKPVDQLAAQKERQRQLGLIDQIKNSEYYMYVQRALVEGQSPEDIAQANPVYWNAFLRSEMMIKEANSIAVTQGLLGGMTPEELGLIKPEQEEAELLPGEEKKKKVGIEDPAWALKAGKKWARETEAERSPVQRALKKVISPTRAREEAWDRALQIGLKKAQRKHGTSVMSYEQAMDLKERSPGAAKGIKFVAPDPETNKVAVFEFYIKNGKLAARKVG